jgi:hypothetical protein
MGEGDMTMTTTPELHTAPKTERPRYETPRILALSEKDILNQFQVTQSMAAWWNAASC